MAFFTHGLYNEYRGEHSIWDSMIQRCTNKNHLHYDRYGGRGISVCKRWLYFENFLADMGRRKKGLTLERKDNNKNYSKKNCTWATMREQSNNKSNNWWITWNGKTQTLSQWARELNIKSDTLSHRIKRKIPMERAMSSLNLKVA